MSNRVWSWEVGGRDWVDFAFQALIALVGGLKAGKIYYFYFMLVQILGSMSVCLNE